MITNEPRTYPKDDDTYIFAVTELENFKLNAVNNQERRRDVNIF